MTFTDSVVERDQGSVLSEGLLVSSLNQEVGRKKVDRKTAIWGLDVENLKVDDKDDVREGE